MQLREPKFWSGNNRSILKYLLIPFSWLFQIVAYVVKKLTKTKFVDVPVICVGNLNVGGSGKTPTTLFLIKYFKGQDKKVAVITRGYKGSLTKDRYSPLKVDVLKHSASEVGDESVILAKFTDTWVAKNRYLGASAAVKAGAEIIILDDGLQNRSLNHDLRICVVNANVGFGNKQVIPAGPLREGIKSGLSNVDMIVSIDGKMKLDTDKPIICAETVVNKEDWATLKHKKLIAFAGLAHPNKFFKTLKAEDFDVCESVPFPDHYMYNSTDISRLFKLADEYNANLVTTEKDWVRLPKEIQKQVLYLRIKLEFLDTDKLNRVIAGVLTK